MMNNTYIKLYRRIRDSAIMSDPPLLAVWIYLLTRASWQKKKWKFGGYWVDLKPGQLITGRKQIAKACGISEQVARRCLRDLGPAGKSSITSRATNHGSIITICKWESYQGNGNRNNQQSNQQTTSKQPANNQHSTTIQEGKKVRKRFHPPSVDEVQQYITEKNYGMDPQRFVDHYTSNGWRVGKNKMKDWRAAARGWESRRIDRGGPRATADPFARQK